MCVAAGLVIRMSCFLSFVHWSAEHLLSDSHATLPFSLTVFQSEWSIQWNGLNPFRQMLLIHLCNSFIHSFFCLSFCPLLMAHSWSLRHCSLPSSLVKVSFCGKETYVLNHPYFLFSVFLCLELPKWCNNADVMEANYFCTHVSAVLAYTSPNLHIIKYANAFRVHQTRVIIVT